MDSYAKKDRISRKLNVLVIGAHPDDIEMGCGGTIIEFRKYGHEVHALIVTDGSNGKNRNVIEREKEAIAGARILNIETLTFGRIRDGQANQDDELFSLILGMLKKHNPDIVIAHANIASEHNDHKNISEVVKSLCAKLPNAIYPLMFEVPVYRVDPSFSPTVYVSIDATIEKKVEAVKQHASEIARKVIDIDRIKQRANMRAIEINQGDNSAEAFVWRAPLEEQEKITQIIPFLICSNC